MPDAKPLEAEIIELTRQLVESIVQSDWKTYTNLNCIFNKTFNLWYRNL